jgi:hypothetical protein
MTTTRKQFVRIVEHPYFMSLIKEARRVKYIVKKSENFFYKVTDDETGDEVFTGMRHSSGKWVTTFSTLYWQEPAL